MSSYVAVLLLANGCMVVLIHMHIFMSCLTLKKQLVGIKLSHSLVFPQSDAAATNHFIPPEREAAIREATKQG